MKSCVLIVVVALGIITPGGAKAQIDVRAVDLRIKAFMALPGRAAALAPACKLRDADWVDDLEAEAVLQAIAPEDKYENSKLSAAEGALANERLDQAKALALIDLTQRGQSVVCAGLRRSRELAKADAMVKERRKPQDWSGAGGIK